MLQKVFPAGSPISHLLVGTARRQYFTLAWNPETENLETKTTLEDVSEAGMREWQTLQQCRIDPTGAHVALSMYDGILSFIRIRAPTRSNRGKAGSYLDEPEQRRLSELQVKDTTFLYPRANVPRIALLHQVGKERRIQLVTYDVYESGKYSDFNAVHNRKDVVDILDNGANMLIPVPIVESPGSRRRHNPRQNSGTKKPHMGGVIVVGETTLTYYDDERKSSEIFAMRESNLFVTWTAIDELRYLLADEFGGLHMMTILKDGNDVVINIYVQEMGRTSTPTTMVALEKGMVFIGSHVGDSQVIKLQLGQHGSRSSFTVIQTMNNIAPIMDFHIMNLRSNGGEVTEIPAEWEGYDEPDEYDRKRNEYTMMMDHIKPTGVSSFSSGQSRLVAGCGAYESGTLQSIRSGIGLEDYGWLGDMPGIRGLFPLRKSLNRKTDTALLISFRTESRVFVFDKSGDITNVDSYYGLTLDEETLLACNGGDGIIQATPTKVIMTETDSDMVRATWQPPNGGQITAVSANRDAVLVCVGGETLFSLNAQTSLKVITTLDFKGKDQISCLHVPRIRHSGHHPHAFIGKWQSRTVSVVNSMTLETIIEVPVSNDETLAIPRDIVQAQLRPKEAGLPTVLVAMSDGTISTFSLDMVLCVTKDERSIALGTQAATLSVIPRFSSGYYGIEVESVFAICELASMICASDGQINYSALSAEDFTHVVPFNTSSFPDSIAVATTAGLKMSVFDAEKVTHVKKLSMGYTPRRLAYSVKENLFAIGLFKREILTGVEVANSGIQLVDDISFKHVGRSFMLDYRDRNTEEIVEAVYFGDLPKTAEGHERLIVGTSFVKPFEDCNGRVLVLGIDTFRNPYLIAQIELKGSCQRLGVSYGHIIAALTRTIVVLEYTETSITTGKLAIIAHHRTATTPIDIEVQGPMIAVTDMMKSVSIMEYHWGENGEPPRLQEVARDVDSRWGTAVGYMGMSNWIGADASGNLKRLKQSSAFGDGYEDPDPEPKLLKNVGEFNLGENVTCIRSYATERDEKLIVTPKAFLSTASTSHYFVHDSKLTVA